MSYKMSRHQADASIVTKGWRNGFDDVHLLHIITHTIYYLDLSLQTFYFQMNI